ncbi:AIR1 [Enterospora canceri]|uniref:AIR1 n=1 Tax=Enterospora canceri TaxID=1081671 RepID=A0A1Y1S8S0_9MICR|nr:AIR1 [Enterospora canceri]
MPRPRMTKNEIEIELHKAFSHIKVTDGFNCVHLNGDVTTEDLLHFVFYNKTITVEKDENLRLQSVEKNRFINEPTCYNCGISGHVSRDCPTLEERRCMWCDIMHKGEPCSMMFCENCGNLGHLENSCRERKNYQSECRVCKVHHDARNCPRKWRKYTLNRKPEKKILSCPMCLSDSHGFGDCDQMEEHFIAIGKNWAKVTRTNEAKRKK